ncbi:MAG: DNA-binding transcriptional repressor ArsR [Methanomethylovorans sp. PtaU1.Bin073]|nr:MAG: DNA-binding transcriptional repressor ArsR [Methanomethylovorans sp. PtaU1.Bin073]
MQCCPKDPEIKLTWEQKLQAEKEISSEEIERICKNLRVLANPTRLRIAYLLSKRDYCVCELVYKLEEKQNLISHHLAVMKQSGIVDSYNHSIWKYYRLNQNVNSILENLKGN